MSAVHVPSLEAPLLARQVLHALPLQGESQHTPSTQFPTKHSLAPPHITPSDFFGAHLPATQYSVTGFGQSASTTHAVSHTIPAQAAVQVWVAPGLQLPLPSQSEGSVSTLGVPGLQLALPHKVLATGGGAQAPLPLQKPGGSQGACGSGHSAC